MLLSSSVMAQSSVDAVKQKSLNKAQQDSVVNKATMSGTNVYENPNLKPTPKLNSATDQYDCDSTCLAMGGNKNSTKTITENKTERCPSGFRDPSGNSFIITATRNVTTTYSGNTATGTTYGAWVPVGQNLSCLQEETRTLGCSRGMSGEKTEARTNYYNGSYTWGTWSITKNTCACPSGMYFDDSWQSCMHPPGGGSGGGGRCVPGSICCTRQEGSSNPDIWVECSNGDCCSAWNLVDEIACVTDDGKPGRAMKVSSATPAWSRSTYTHGDGFGHLYLEIGPPGPWSEPRVFHCVAN